MKKIITIILGKKILQKFRIFFYKILSDNSSKINYRKVIQPVLMMGNGEIKISENNTFGVYRSPGFYSGYSYLEAREKNSKIVIGNNNVFNNNCTIISKNSEINIGENCLFGNNLYIINSDFHLDSEEKASTKIFIENKVFIGSNVTILKGVSIGENSVIGANSVVSKSIPANVIAAGNPCKVIRQRL